MLGALLIFWGLNALFSFMPEPPMIEKAMVFRKVLDDSQYIMPMIVGFELVAGLLLIINRWVPANHIIILPVTSNIFLFHLVLNPTGIGGGLIALTLNSLLIVVYQKHYRSLLTARALPDMGSGIFRKLDPLP